MDKIICIGKNYLDHAKELGDPVPENPVIFLKPPSILKQVSHWGEKILLSLPDSNVGEIHHECEVVLKLKKGGYKLSLSEAKNAIEAVTLGLDMTQRTTQSKLKQTGAPWTIAKVFIDAAVIGPWIEKDSFPDFMKTSFSFSLERRIKQHAKLEQMRLSPEELVIYASQFFPLCENDILFTGTPAGVGAVHKGSQATLQWGDYQYSVEWL